MNKNTEYTLDDRIKEAERELAMREKVFPRWVQIGKIKPQVAKERIELQKLIIDDLKKLKAILDNKPDQLNLFEAQNSTAQ